MADQHLVWLLLAWCLPAVVLGWWLPARLQAAAITACGMGFMASVSPLSLAVLLGASLLAWWVQGQAGRHSRAVLLATLAIVLVFAAFLATGERSDAGIGAGVVLPLGMAFYCLRLVHYLLEAYKGSLPVHGLPGFLCYQFFPATLPVGPIHRFDDFQRDLRRRRWHEQECSLGLQRVLYGLAKLVVVGNYLLELKLGAWMQPWIAAPGIGGAYATALLYWAKLYVFFSGFSDIAIGVGLLAGFHIRENFRWPFLSRNIADFWQRWHVSLSSWCRDYVYAPVLSAGRSHLLAALASMLVLGLWHEPSLRYLLWGAYHGLGIAVHRVFAARAGPVIAAWPAWLQRAWSLLAMLLTLHFVIFSFAVTTAAERFLRGG